MNRINVSRRALVTALLGGGVSALAFRYWISAAAAESALSLKLPEAKPAEAPSFAVFLALSQLVTLRPQLDESVARRMYPLFLDEPWGAHHIHSTYTQLLGLIEHGAVQPKPAHPGDKLGKGQAWFASHLLTTWYLGIYYHERTPPLRVSYTEALMYDPVRAYLPRRFAEGTGFGAWSIPPSTPNRS